MIPLIIVWLIKYWKRVRSVSQTTAFRKTIHIIFALAMLPKFISAQEKILRYNILHNGDIKGTMTIRHQVSENRIHLKIESEVKTRFLIRVTVQSIEEAIFENGILIYSSLCRIVNGEEKINQQMLWSGVAYKLNAKNKIIAVPAYPIRYSMLSLYYQEPVNVTKIYSDNFQQYVDVKKINQNTYQLSLPNGNVNYYHYMNGTCVRVDVNQFYNLQFQLIP